MKKIILKAIGESLRGAGNCPYDAACPFGRSIKCTAPRDVLEDRIEVIKRRLSEPNQFAAQLKDGPWHCDNIGIVRFVDPDEE
ncbi:hypothetical protein [Cohnella sp. GCM10027633]|uniref:hypothetical protein n=1 Tax=unclassified Cohnella TaxID=2636738 RepID=UPI00362C6D21